MWEQIFAALKAKYQNKGISDATLKKMAVKAAEKITDEAAIAAWVDEQEFAISTMQSEADARANSATATERAKHVPATPPTPATPPATPPTTPPAPVDPNMPAYMVDFMKTMTDGIKNLNDKVAGMEKEKETKSRKDQLTEALANAPKAFKDATEANFEYMVFPDDAKFGEWLTSVKTAAGTADQQHTQEGVRGTPRPGAPAPATPPSKTASKEQIDEVMSQMPKI